MYIRADTIPLLLSLLTVLLSLLTVLSRRVPLISEQKKKKKPVEHSFSALLHNDDDIDKTNVYRISTAAIPAFSCRKNLQRNLREEQGERKKDECLSWEKLDSNVQDFCGERGGTFSRHFPLIGKEMVRKSSDTFMGHGTLHVIIIRQCQCIMIPMVIYAPLSGMSSTLGQHYYYYEDSVRWTETKTGREKESGSVGINTLLMGTV